MIDLIIELYHKPEYHPYFLLLSGHKEAGRRTLSLVSLGSCLYTLLPFLSGHVSDPWRMGAQVITGIGFVGGGVLVKEGGTVKGITTASTIWLSAAIGVCFAADMIFMSIFCCVIGFFILRLKDPFDV
jgi:putative Mg2+ transporter-C (MgtC) family protein